MFSYQKRLQFPINIKRKDLRMARLLVTQYGGANGELAAALRYLNQRISMPDNRGRALLTDIGTEELGHVEMIQTMIHQLVKGATPQELKAAGLDPHYAEHGKGIYPTDANGVPFTITYVSTTGDALADLYEDMAAEQKARAVYENLIDLTTDQDVIQPLLWLRQREIVHFTRFKELFEYYNKKEQEKNKNFNTKDYKNMDMNMTDMLTMDKYSDYNNYSIKDNASINTPSSLDITNGLLDNMNLDFNNIMMRRMF